jgi:hypothetical protein
MGALFLFFSCMGHFFYFFHVWGEQSWGTFYKKKYGENKNVLRYDLVGDARSITEILNKVYLLNFHFTWFFKKRYVRDSRSGENFNGGPF